MDIRTLINRNMVVADMPAEPVIYTITRTEVREWEKPGEKKERKLCVHFKETPLPWSVPPSFLTTLGNILGVEETDKWPGKKLCLFVDPDVKNPQGRKVGGIRARKA